MSTRQSTKQTKKVAPQFDLGFVPTDERQINYEGTKELDPIADRDMRLEELSFIASQKTVSYTHLTLPTILLV